MFSLAFSYVQKKPSFWSRNALRLILSAILNFPKLDALLLNFEFYCFSLGLCLILTCFILIGFQGNYFYLDEGDESYEISLGAFLCHTNSLDTIQLVSISYK